ncbi:DNA cross-link repair protein PSO2/SNM1 [Nakaseomyces bracarensis]|uniref:DNA cross-link repair protein PSO2/SNM1 n=1 Tax=Nakaseomyces bracarensis TaxID=273131 RepID=A0ABR4NPL8_9SACH
MSQRRSLLEIDQHDILRQRKGKDTKFRARNGKRSSTIPATAVGKKQRTLTEFNIPTTAVLAVKRRKLHETSSFSDYIPIEILDSDENDSSSSIEILDDCDKEIDTPAETVSTPKTVNQPKSFLTQRSQLAIESRITTTDIEIVKGDVKSNRVNISFSQESLKASALVQRFGKKSPKNDDTGHLICPMCSMNLKDMPLFDRETHCDKCIENENQNENEIEIKQKIMASSKKTMDKNNRKQSLANSKPKIQSQFTNSIENTVIATSLAPTKPLRKKKREYIPQSFKILTFKSGFKLIVDGFTYKLGPDSNIKDFFLSHFHADHYIGLKKSWNLGTLYSSVITSNLLKFRYTPKRKSQNEEDDITNCIKELQNHEQHWLNESICVTTLEANHCPGASLFLFEEWNSDRTDIIKTILHTGDFRSDSAVIASINKLINGRPIDEIYLDTTYLLSTFTFPDQNILLEMIADFVKQINIPNFRHSFFADKQKSILPFMNDMKSKDARSEIPILYLVGTYSIGKEKLAIKVAEALKTKIYVQSDSIKKKMVELYWPLTFDNDILTNDPSQSRVHLVSLKVLSDATSIDRYMKNLKEKHPTITYKEIFGFIPTGWTFGNRYQKAFQYDSNLSYEENHKNRINFCVNLLNENCMGKYNNNLEWLKTQYKPRNKYQVFKVPYSEHSSFIELLKFCVNIPWHSLISTVNVDNGVNSAETSEWFKTFKYILENKDTLLE